MKAEIFWIASPPPGRLAVMPRPRGGDWLEDEIASLHQSGVQRLISLLTPAETTELDLRAEPVLCKARGLIFESFPFEDRSTPPPGRATRSFIAHLQERLQASESIAIHCRMGIGRSATLAAAVLACSGVAPAEALDRIQQARGLRVPDTEAQRAWLIAFAQSLGSAQGWA